MELLFSKKKDCKARFELIYQLISEKTELIKRIN